PRDVVNQSIIIYVTVNVDKRRPLLNHADAAETILSAWRAADHWLIGRYVIMPDHLHFFCAPVVPTTTLKQLMQL
ncbi:MAG TPA: hypothetical protein VNT99_10460, partial [Methylomirabilota bacterium]|nr:hypothetical protein [Methylomirabilota bacterium]